MDDLAGDRHAIDDLGSTVLAVGAETGVLVLTGSNLHGSVPVDLYRTLAANLRNFGVLVVADLSGDEQREALAGGVDILKVSHEELAADGWSDADDEEFVDDEAELRDSARTLARAADGLLVAGGAIAVVGIALVTVHVVKAKKQRAVSWVPSPSVGPRTVGLGWTGRF